MYGIAKILQEVERSAERFRFANRSMEGGIFIKEYKVIGMWQKDDDERRADSRSRNAEEDFTGTVINPL